MAMSSCSSLSRSKKDGTPPPRHQQCFYSQDGYNTNILETLIKASL